MTGRQISALRVLKNFQTSRIPIYAKPCRHRVRGRRWVATFEDSLISLARKFKDFSAVDEQETVIEGAWELKGMHRLFFKNSVQVHMWDQLSDRDEHSLFTRSTLDAWFAVHILESNYLARRVAFLRNSKVKRMASCLPRLSNVSVESALAQSAIAAHKRQLLNITASAASKGKNEHEKEERNCSTPISVNVEQDVKSLSVSP